MKLSVVLATRNRADALSRLFKRLDSMPNPSDWEIIIANNGSSDATAEILADWSSRLPIKTIFVPLPGKSRALNAALALVSGDLVLFTDDDVEPLDDWLLRWSEKLALHPTRKVFGGRIRVEEASVPRWIMGSGNLQEMLISKHDLGDRDQPYPFNRYPIGPNMAVRRDAMGGVRWREDLGPGTRVPLGDERAFLSQISGPGDTDRMYFGDVDITHHPEACRLTRINCWRRCFFGWLSGRQD